MKNETIITFMGQSAKVNCDRKCNKAWGINGRPRIQLSDDPDDYAFRSDEDLGDAPIDPGTYEGDDAKPLSPDNFPNKWCIRECERSNMSEPGMSDKSLPIRNFSMELLNKRNRQLAT